MYFLDFVASCLLKCAKMRFLSKFFNFLGVFMRGILVFLFFVFSVAQATTGLNKAPNLQEMKWGNGMTLLKFFQQNGVPQKVYYDLEYEDKELADEIQAGANIWVLKDRNNKLLQALIPVTDELQIHISKTEKSYKMDFLPIEYEVEEKILSLELSNSPHADIANASGLTSLANAFVAAFRGTINFKNAKKGDRLVIFYKQKKRMGRHHGVEIQAAMMETKDGKFRYAYRFKDAYYDENAMELEKYFLLTPVKNARISSHFSPRRFHPVLHRYRAHLGTDYAAPRGTRVHAAGNGKVVHVGTKGGYGKTVIIKHIGSEYSTLYAHLDGYAKGLKVGQSVKQGELIGFVGSTGMSTGPHLHFGMYRGQTAVDPQRVLKVVKSASSIKDKELFKKVAKAYNDKLNSALASSHQNPAKELSFSNIKRL